MNDNLKDIQNKEKLLDNAKEKINEDDDDEMRFERRPGRQFTMNFMAFNKNFNKLIIPYDFDKKNYFIKKEEIDFYEYKDYVMATLDKFCNDPVFNIEKKYKAKGLEKFCLFVPNFFLILFIIYIFVFIGFLTYGNPAILFITFMILKKTYSSLKIMRFIIKEKMKIKEVNRKLLLENSSAFCVEKKIKWILGQSGYWMELVKNV